jgi:hypothetical protein
MARIPEKKIAAYRTTIFHLSVDKWDAAKIAQQINKLRFLGKTMVSAKDIMCVWKPFGSREGFVREYRKWRRAQKRERLKK